MTLMRQSGDVHLSKACIELFDQNRQKIKDVDALNLGYDPADYDRFVTVGLR